MCNIMVHLLISSQFKLGGCTTFSPSHQRTGLAPNCQCGHMNILRKVTLGLVMYLCYRYGLYNYYMLAVMQSRYLPAYAYSVAPDHLALPDCLIWALHWPHEDRYRIVDSVALRSDRAHVHAYLELHFSQVSETPFSRNISPLVACHIFFYHGDVPHKVWSNFACCYAHITLTLCLRVHVLMCLAQFN